jgi:hypothetical protein
MPLSVTDCRKFLKNHKLTDEELQKVIDELYKVSYEIIGNYFKALENADSKTTTS